MAVDVIVPALGESIREASIGQWLKQPGEAVAADEPVVSLETDKVAVEVPAPAAGVMGELMFQPGDTVTVGALIARIVDGGAAAAPAPAAPAPAAPAPVAAPAPAPVAAPVPAPAAEATAYEAISPAVRGLIDSYNIDPASISGTGKDGRLTKGDVLAAIEAGTARLKAAATPAPAAVAAVTAAPAARREERVKMTRLRQTIARRLKEAQNTAAMLTTFNDVDMTAVIEARARYKDMFEKKHGVRLGFMSFFAKAVVLALKDVPSVGASIEGDEIVYKDYADLGVAVSSPGGLVVPILKDADKLSFAAIEKAIADFGKRAGNGTLTLAEMQGGNFTISNGGVFGSLLSTPILNPPQSGVLGMHRIEDRPVVRDGQIVVRPMMYLALSYDHRLIDGREAVTFLVRVKEALEDPARLLIDL
jgi:2-oxoglutarate dehydrogenase E2 component (dihydrolipoamide succinyltransferase)